MKEMKMLVISRCSRESDSRLDLKSITATCIAKEGKIGEALKDYIEVEHPDAVIEALTEWETKCFFTIPIIKELIAKSNVLKIWRYTWLEVEVKSPWNKEEAKAEKERRARLKKIYLRSQWGPVWFDVTPEEFEEYMKDEHVREWNKTFGIE